MVVEIHFIRAIKGKVKIWTYEFEFIFFNTIYLSLSDKIFIIYTYSIFILVHNQWIGRTFLIVQNK